MRGREEPYFKSEEVSTVVQQWYSGSLAVGALLLPPDLFWLRAARSLPAFVETGALLAAVLLALLRAACPTSDKLITTTPAGRRPNSSFARSAYYTVV